MTMGTIAGLIIPSLMKNEPEDVINELRETLGKGPCNKCGKIAMVPDEKGICQYCLECGYAENEHLYLRDLAGYPTESEE